jgi:DNA-binding CsgD family transcriptional regulator
VRARVRLATGQWPDALADVDRLMSSAVRPADVVVPALVVRGRIQSATGHADALSTLDEAGSEADRIAEPHLVAEVAAARSEHFLWYGDPARAAAEARRGLETAQAVDELSYRLYQAGEPPASSTLADGPYGMLLRGDWAGAAAEFERRGASYARAQALTHGDEAAVGEGLRTLDRIGASRTAQHLRTDLRRRGVVRVPRGPRGSTAANIAGLTRRQGDVLALLAEGMTNAQIAARLMLSPRTVEHHIAAILAKFNVTTRGAAAAAAHRLELTVP